MYDNTGNFQSLQIQLSGLQERYTHSEIQHHLHPTLLDHSQEANMRLMKEIEGILKLEENIEALIEEKKDAEMIRDEAWEEIKKLKEENEILRNHAAGDEGASAGLAFLEKLRNCTKDFDALKLAANSQKQEIEELKATIDMKNKTIEVLEAKVKLVTEPETQQIGELTATIERKNKTIKLLETRAKEYKDWS